MKVKDLDRDKLMALAQATYEKSDWLSDDITTLRACWAEFEKRGGFNAVMFFRGPGFFGALKVHEIESGEVTEEDVRMFERTGAEIAADYRDIMRKLRNVTDSADVASSADPHGSAL
jgi:hypothetical protein